MISGREPGAVSSTWHKSCTGRRISRPYCRGSGAIFRRSGRLLLLRKDGLWYRPLRNCASHLLRTPSCWIISGQGAFLPISPQGNAWRYITACAANGISQSVSKTGKGGLRYATRISKERSLPRISRMSAIMQWIDGSHRCWFSRGSWTISRTWP